MTEATQTLTLTEFLLARIAEDEAGARAATPGRWEGTFDDSGRPYWVVTTALTGDQVGTHDVGTPSEYEEPHGREAADAYHIARHDPARVLAECEAKRQLVDLHSPSRGSFALPMVPTCPECVGFHANLGCEGAPYPCDTLRILAAVYADHSDYREEWKP